MALIREASTLRTRAALGMRDPEETSYCATILLMTVVGTSIGVFFVIVRESLGIKT